MVGTRHGLQAWAVVVSISGKYYHHGFPGNHTGGPEITVAVRNTSQTDLFVPASASFIHAAITTSKGTITNLNLNHKVDYRGGEVAVHKLAPGATTYLVSFGRSELQKGIPYVDLLDNLAPGIYTAVVECKNDVPEGRAWSATTNAPAWTGDLKAPSIDFEITVQEALGSPSPEAREAAAKIARETFVPTPRSHWTSLTNQLGFGTPMSNVVALLDKTRCAYPAHLWRRRRNRLVDFSTG